MNCEKIPDYDFINPEHYKSFPMETIAMMVEIWGEENVATHCEITAFKYKMRMGIKPDQPVHRDLAKVKWYLDKAKELRSQKATRPKTTSTLHDIEVERIAKEQNIKDFRKPLHNYLNKDS